MGMENKQILMPGDPVVVVRGIGELEKELLGQRFILQRFSKPHGYAVVIASNDVHYHLHPESLSVYSGPEDFPGYTARWNEGSVEWDEDSTDEESK